VAWSIALAFPVDNRGQLLGAGQFGVRQIGKGAKVFFYKLGIPGHFLQLKGDPLETSLAFSSASMDTFVCLVGIVYLHDWLEATLLDRRHAAF